MPSVRFPAPAVARRFAILSLAVATVGGGLGCQGAQDAADAPAQEDLTQAQQAMDLNRFSEAQTAADAAAAIQGVSPEMAYKVHLFRGNLYLANAHSLLSRAQDAQLNASRLLGQVRLDTMQASLAQAQLKSDQANDPASAIDDLRARIADAQGASGSTDWLPPKLPPYTPPVIEVPAAPPPAAPPEPATAASGAKPAKGIGGFFSAFLGAKPTAPVAPATAPAPDLAAPATIPAPQAPTPDLASIPVPPAKPLDILPIRSLAGLDTNIAQLKSAISANDDQTQSLQSQRLTLLSQADDLEKKSLKDSGQNSVDDIAASAETGRKAAELAVDIEKLAAAKVDLQADLGKASVQRAGVQAAIDGYNRQIADLELSWKGVQQNIEDQKRAIAALAGPAAPASQTPQASGDANLPSPPPSALTIADQCSQLKTAVTDARDLREKAADQLKNAIREFNSAGNSGDLLRSAYSSAQTERTSPGERTALQQLQETFNGAAPRLLAADAERTLALNYASDAMIARQIKDSLTAAQSALGPDAPSSLADCLAATTASGMNMEDYGSLAEERFKDALDHFDALSNQSGPGPGPTSRKAAAMAGKMITAYGAKQLSLAMQQKPVAGQTATELQQSINDSAKNLFDVDPTMLPAIPYTITPTPSTPGT